MAARAEVFPECMEPYVRQDAPVVGQGGGGRDVLVPVASDLVLVADRVVAARTALHAVELDEDGADTPRVHRATTGTADDDLAHHLAFTFVGASYANGNPAQRGGR